MVHKALTFLSETFGSQGNDKPPECQMLIAKYRLPKCVGVASTSWAVSTFSRDPAL